MERKKNNNWPKGTGKKGRKSENIRRREDGGWRMEGRLVRGEKRVSCEVRLCLRVKRGRK